MILKSKDDIEEQQEQGQLAVIEKLVTTLNGAVDKLVATSKGKTYYDKDLGSTIKNAIESIGKLKQELDLSPIVRLTAEVATQNNIIIGLLQKNPGDSKVIELIMKQNELITKALSVEKPKAEWTFDIVRNKANDRIQQVIAKSK